MKIVSKKTKIIKVSPVIGFGYWMDTYKEEVLGVYGIAHNILLPFLRIQWGYLSANVDQDGETFKF